MFLHYPQADLQLQLESGIFLCRGLNTFKVAFFQTLIQPELYGHRTGKHSLLSNLIEL